MGLGVAVEVGAIVGVGVGVGVASGVGLGVGADVAVGVAAAVGSGVGVLVGTGVGVGVGSGVAVAVAAGVEVGVAVGGGVAEGVATAAGVGVGVATGTGVSAGATVAVGCGSVVGSGVAAGAAAAAAVGVAGAVVATAGEVCSPPQAVRAMTADRHSSNSTAAAFTVPVILPLMNFMAPFSAPGKVGSMPWTVYPPGVRVDSGGCLGRAVTPEFLFPRGGSAARVGPPSASTGPTGPRARHSWRAGSVQSPGLRPAVRRPVVRTAVSTSGPPAKALGPQPWTGRTAGFPAGVGKRVGPVDVRGLKSHPGRTDFPEFLPIGAKAAPFSPIPR